MVTSRNQLTGLIADGAHHLSLDLLPAADARTLLARRLGAPRVDTEPDAVDTIVAGCGRLPLAIAVVAARAAARPRLRLAALVAELLGSRGLDAIDGGDPATDIRAVFSWSYQALSTPAADLFRLLGLHPGPDFTAAAAASLAGVPAGAVRPSLAELTGAHLVEEHTPGRYRLHDLLRAYATELAGADEAALRRLLDHYLHTGYAADRLINPQRDPIALGALHAGVTAEEIVDRDHAMAWFAAEHSVLLALTEHAAATGFDGHAWRLPWILADFFHLRGYHHLANTQDIALRAAGRVGDLTGQAHAHRILASAHDRMGRYDEARIHLGHAIDLYGRLGDLTGQAHIRFNLGSVLGRQGRFAEALEHAQQAFEAYRAASRPVWQARSLDAIGWLHAQLGEHERALEYCRQALALHQEVGDRHGEAETWDSLGFAHHRLAHHDQAVACYRRAVALFRDIGDRFNQAVSLANLGDTLHAGGDRRSSRAAWRAALVILDDLGHPDAARVRAKLDR